MRAIACECFVDRVVNGFINEVVQTFLTDVADVHGRALAHSFQAFKHLDITGGIIATVLFDFFHILISKSGLRPLSCFLFFATCKCGTLLSTAHSADFNEGSALREGASSSSTHQTALQKGVLDASATCFAIAKDHTFKSLLFFAKIRFFSQTKGLARQFYLHATRLLRHFFILPNAPPPNTA